MSFQNDMLAQCTGFEWDEGNTQKNWEKHEVAWEECEEIFFNQPLIVAQDLAHSLDEPRLYALGKTDRHRRLFIAFTIREKRVRVISARDMTAKESRKYRRHERS